MKSNQFIRLMAFGVIALLTVNCGSGFEGIGILDSSSSSTDAGFESSTAGRGPFIIELKVYEDGVNEAIHSQRYDFGDRYTMIPSLQDQMNQDIESRLRPLAQNTLCPRLRSGQKVYLRALAYYSSKTWLPVTYTNSVPHQCPVREQAPPPPAPEPAPPSEPAPAPAPPSEPEPATDLPKPIPEEPELPTEPVEEPEIDTSQDAAIQGGFRLNPGDRLVSKSGNCFLTYQGDGNLVSYCDGNPVWASNTADTSAGFAVFQHDGNLVIYDGGGNPIWASNTAGHSGAILRFYDGGNIGIYDSRGETAFWYAF